MLYFQPLDVHSISYFYYLFLKYRNQNINYQESYQTKITKKNENNCVLF